MEDAREINTFVNAKAPPTKGGTFLSNKKRLALLVLSGVMLMGCQFLVNLLAFFPDRHDLIPENRLPPGVREVYISTPDGKRLQCYWLAHPQSRRLLIYFHGNAGNIGHRLPDLQKLAGMGLNVLGMGYRGYGKSTGKPSEKGIYTDGRAALAHAEKELGFDRRHIILFGRSIGSTVAVELGSSVETAGLVLISPMTSAKAVGKAAGYGPVARLAGSAFDNLSKIKRLKGPLLIVHGTADEVIPFAMGEQLNRAAPDPKRFVAIDGAGHNDISAAWAGPYWQAIQTFIDELPSR